MNSSENALQPQWLRIGAAFALICLFAFTQTGKPGLVISSASFALLGMISFSWVSNWLITHLKHDDTSELICSLAWFGLWSTVCTLGALPGGWMLFGLIVAFCGWLLLVSKRDRITYEQVLDTIDPIERRRLMHRLRMQCMLDETIVLRRR